MNAKYALLIGTGLLSVSALMMHPAESAGAAAQTGKPIKMHRLYTGPDGQTHAQEIEVKFGPSGTDPFKLAAGAGAEIRRAPPGRLP